MNGFWQLRPWFQKRPTLHLGFVLECGKITLKKYEHKFANEHTSVCIFAAQFEGSLVTTRCSS
jgi:hypothetical protein